MSTSGPAIDIAEYNARWLAAWTSKDVEGLCGIYADDCRYFDPQNPQGLTGSQALRTYLTNLFAATPVITYSPDEVWPIPDGFCGRWYCEIAGAGRMRGFDLVILRGDKIAHNEVYVHPLVP